MKNEIFIKYLILVFFFFLRCDIGGFRDVEKIIMFVNGKIKI